MEFLLKWLMLVGLQAVAAISPGPAFVLQVKSTLTHGRTYGLFTALGLAGGVAVYACAVMAGMAVVLAGSKWVLYALRYAGAAYLIYIGLKGLTSKRKSTAPSLDELALPINPAISTRKKWEAFRTAFIAQILNPKALMYFTAVFAQFITPGTSFWVLTLYGVTITLVEYLWWVLLAFILTHPQVKDRFSRLSHWIERVCGGLLVMLGIRLALSKIH